MNHFPFRKDPAPALTRTILRIVNEGSEGDTHGDGATSPPRKTGGATSRRRGKGTPVPVVSAPTTPRVSEPLKISECGDCMTGALKSLKAANTEDLKEKGGKAGKQAHKRLHKTIARVVGEEVESVDEGLLGRVKKKLQRAGQAVRTAASDKPSLRTQLGLKQHRHAIAAAAERRKREAEEQRKHPKPQTKTRRGDSGWSFGGGRGSGSSSGDDGGWMGAAGI